METGTGQSQYCKKKNGLISPAQSLFKQSLNTKGFLSFTVEKIDNST